MSLKRIMPDLREVELSSVSKDALYKRWERFKKSKLRNILQDVSLEEMKVKDRIAKGIRSFHRRRY